MGPGFNSASPVELTVRFVKDEQGNVSGISLQRSNAAPSFAKRVPLKREEVVFQSAAAKLSGTLIVPATEGPHPAIILLHGSGPLTRYSFGPYPHFFTSLGLAVLIYDKRGSGESTGTLLDASTGALKSLLQRYHYPDGLTEDALAAFRFLQGRKEIDPEQIGFWGSSEGGMVATQVAARSKDVAFAIDSSGFMGPLWQTLQYQTGALARERGVPEAQIEEALAFSALWMRVARTGEDYEMFLAAREKARRENKAWLLNWRSGEYSMLEQMRWDWDRTLSFSPLPELKDVTCPVLGIWGERDPLTDAPEAARSMETALTEAGNKDFMTRIIPNGSHSLMEMPGRTRMAPGVFDTLRTWLLKRVEFAGAATQKGPEAEDRSVLDRTRFVWEGAATKR
jgi:pimeloyl-ACP methyl ester carboxylesterase